MPAEMTLWSYVTQWLGYLSWCASASDPACRPFVGFLALFGASAGTLSLLVLGLIGMMNGWERDVEAARALAGRRRKRVVRESVVRPAVPRAEPALGLGVAAAAYAGHAEPLVPAAAALAVDSDPVRAASAIGVPLRRTL